MSCVFQYCTIIYFHTYTFSLCFFNGQMTFIPPLGLLPWKAIHVWVWRIASNKTDIKKKTSLKTNKKSFKYELCRYHCRRRLYLSLSVQTVVDTPAHWFLGQTGQEECTPCPGRFACDEEGLVFPYTLCSAGYYCRISSNTTTPELGKYCAISTNNTGPWLHNTISNRSSFKQGWWHGLIW